MKKTFFILLFWPSVALCQSYVNPDTTYQSGDIILKNTDVYYKPFAPPGDSDTRVNLCNESDLLRDPNGVGNQYRNYYPIVYDTFYHKFDSLQYWAPWRNPVDSLLDTLGQNVVWQRLFTARRKQNGTPSNIIAGGIDTVKDTVILTLWPLPPDTVIYTTLVSPRVTVSKNEDVDFRASGRIELKSGFHVMPGSFFHAYTEPNWDTTVFSDEFNDTAKFRNQWYVANGNSDNYGAQVECSFDTDVRLWPDSDAHDGWALDVMLREDTVDTCSCSALVFNFVDSCQGTLDPLHPAPQKNIFSSAIIRSCPFPFASVSHSALGPAAYAHSPYGKYEIRDKIPHVFHHTNNWGGNSDLEWDLGETDNATMGVIHPGWSHDFRYGPCNGIFKKLTSDTVVFVSPGAGWCNQNQPYGISINNFFYRVTGRGKDTAVTQPNDYTSLQGGFPSSLANDTTDSVSFYYERLGSNTADSVTWTVSDTVFSAPYNIAGQLFSKDYQPTSITLTTDTTIPGHPIKKTFNCRWDHTLNEILLVNPDDSPDTLDSTDLHTNTEAYKYTILEQAGYPIPTVLIDSDTLPDDTAAYATTPYRYHTFTMEWLPNEVRFLIDSNVVRRFPDRLIPPGEKHHDWASTEPRSPASIRPAEFDIDGSGGNDPFGTDDTVAYTYHGYNVYKSLTYYERKYFESHPHSPGFWDVNGQHAAHHLIDYVKVWDVPKDVIIPGYPH